MSARVRKPDNLDDKYYAKVKSFGSRLKQARIDKKKVQAELAKDLGLTRSSIAQWEGGLSTPSNESIIELSHLLGVRQEYLAFGITDEPIEILPSASKLGYVMLPEVTFTSAKKYEETDNWALPINLIMSNIANSSDIEDAKLVMVKMHGDNMSPRYEDGDRVLVDMNDTKLSPAGTFLHWDGVGPLFSKMGVVPSAPTGKKASSPTIQVSDERGEFTYTSAMKDLTIIGRAKGVWKS